MFLLNILRLIRWNNLLITGVTGFIIIYINPQVFVHIFTTEFIAMSWTLIVLMITQAAAGNIINDIIDEKVDEINKPSKTIVGKEISRKSAFKLYLLFSIVSWTSAIWLTIHLGHYFYLMTVLVYQVLLYLYSKYLQKLAFIGNVVVSILVAGVVPISYSLVVFFWPDAFSDWRFNYLLIGLFIYALFINLLREIVKDVEDQKGDKVFGYQTLSILLNQSTIKRLLMIGMGIMVLFSIIANLAVLLEFHWTTAFVAFLLILSPAMILFYWSINHSLDNLINRLKSGLKVYLLLGMLFYMILLVSLVQ